MNSVIAYICKVKVGALGISKNFFCANDYLLTGLAEKAYGNQGSIA